MKPKFRTSSTLLIKLTINYYFRNSPWTSLDVILEGKDWPAGLLPLHDDNDDDGELFKMLTSYMHRVLSKKGKPNCSYVNKM
jgi:hypothetical protein